MEVEMTDTALRRSSSKSGVLHGDAQPLHTRRWRRWQGLGIALLVLVCAVAMGIIAGVVAQERKLNTFDTYIDTVCTATGLAIAADLQAVADSLRMISALELRPELLTSPILDKIVELSRIYGLGKLFYVRDADRAAFEMEHNITVLDIDVNNNFSTTVAPQRDDYAVLVDLAPAFGRTQRGWDQLHDPARSHSLRTAMETGKAATTVVFRPERGHLLYMSFPLFPELIDPGTPAARKENITGFLLASVPLNEIIFETIERNGLSAADWEVRVYEPQLSNFTDGSNLLYNRPATRNLVHDLSASSWADITDQRTRVQCIPTVHRRDRFVSHEGLRVGCIAGSVTLLFCALLAIVLCFQSCLREEVKQRTAELQRVAEENRSLADNYLQAKREAEDAVASRGKLMAFVCHELRNPLHSVAAMNSFMVEDGSLTDNQRVNVQATQQAVELMLRIVNDMLLLSKLDANKLQLDYIPFNIRNVLSSAVKCHEMQAELAGIELGFTVANDVPMGMFGDPTRLCQVVTNLLSNGIKFTSKGGVYVTVSVCAPPTERAVADANRVFVKSAEVISSAADSPHHQSRLDLDSVTVAPAHSSKQSLHEHTPNREQWISIEVRDTGVGIPDHLATELFKPYMQVHASSEAAHRGGTGLGLSIVASFVKLMNGVITFRSQAEQGSVFRVLLPVRPCHLADIEVYNAALPKAPAVAVSAASAHVASAPAAASAESEVPLQSGELKAGTEAQELKRGNDARLRILLAEDNVMNRQIFLRMVRDVNCEVVTAENGLIAVETVANALVPFDIIFMDIMMPVMEGHEAARVLRAQGVSAPIIALTGNALQEDRDKATGAGMTDYVCKPFSKHTLLKLLSQYTH